MWTAKAEILVCLATALAEGSIDATNVLVQDRLGILDFPDTDVQQSNIVSVSALSRVDLLQRAAECPAELTTTEIDLLKQRFRLDITPAEQDADVNAESQLQAVSEEHWRAATEQLKQVSTLLYEASEEQAVYNAQMEDWRREMDAMKQRRRAEFEGRLPTAQPWVRQLWEEDHAEQCWGFAAFLDPEVDEEVVDEYNARKGGALWWARYAVGCIGPLESKWRMQRLDWPDELQEEERESVGDAGKKTAGETTAGETTAGETTAGEETRSEKMAGGEYTAGHKTAGQKTAGQKTAGQKTAGQKTAGQKTAGEEEANEDRVVQAELSNLGEMPLSEADIADLEAEVGPLRRRFQSLRDRGAKKQATSTHTRTSRPGLDDGVLDNVFVLIDQPCVGSVFSPHGNVDDMWVWAIDPDYHVSNPETDTYRGYLRVRLQQLVNSFFECRRFHAEELPMKTLWEAAQWSRNQIFVSVREPELNLWTSSRDVGSALRPATASVKVIKGLDASKAYTTERGI